MLGETHTGRSDESIRAGQGGGSPRILVALHRGTSWIGKLIEWQTRSDYSHAALIFVSKWEEQCALTLSTALEKCEVVESREFHGVRVTDGILREPHTAVDIFSVRYAGGVLTENQNAKLRQFAHEQIGKPYDYTMVARFLSRRGESNGSREKWFCSELVFAAFAQVGVQLLRDTKGWEVSPGLLSKSPLLNYEGTFLPEIREKHGTKRGVQIPYLVQQTQFQL